MAREAVALLVCACIVAGVAASLEDGLPRPANFPDEPSVRYGPVPQLTENGMPVACEWYGFSNTLYEEPITSACQTSLRSALTNETVNPPNALQPFVYYTLMRLIDPATNESYCYQGCFQWEISTGAGPAPAPYFRGPAMAPLSYDGPAMAPYSESPYTAPTMSPGN